MKISRIRLSDKTSRLHPRHVVPKPAQAHEPEVPVKVREWIFVTSAPAFAQDDLGPQVMKFGDGIYAYVGKSFKSNTGVILTQDGVVLIDSGHDPTDSRAVMDT